MPARAEKRLGAWSEALGMECRGGRPGYAVPLCNLFGMDVAPAVAKVPDHLATCSRCVGLARLIHRRVSAMHHVYVLGRHLHAILLCEGCVALDAVNLVPTDS